MAKGAFCVRSLYPGDIAVQDTKAFEFFIDGCLAIASVNRHLVALLINDFGNAIKFTDEGQKRVPKLKVPITAIDQNLAAFDPTTDHLVFLVDHTHLDYRQYTGRAFSEILIGFEIDDTEAFDDKEFEFYNAALQKFIRAYRHVSRDVSILMPDRLLRDVPITMVSAVPYSEEELQMPARERLLKPRALKFGVWKVNFAEFAKYLPKTNPATLANSLAIEERFNTGVLFDESHDGLLRAYEELAVHENPKWALLDAFMVVELAVARFINEAKIEKGVSRKKLDDYRRDIGISYMLNVDLPLLLFPLLVEERQMIQAADSVRNKRNKVVHEGVAVSKEEALGAVNAVSNLLDLLKRRSAGT